jgi:ribonucleoside-diphosphate reductase alpha chain
MREYAPRTVKLENSKGVAVYEETVSAPPHWSDRAVRIAASKYLRGALNTPEREKGVNTLLDRLSGAFPESMREDILDLLYRQRMAFNSPVWFNLGTSAPSSDSECFSWSDSRRCVVRKWKPQVSACFIQSVSDSLQDIMRLATSEAMLFKGGSGSGTNLSALRSATETLSGSGGYSSGPLSFMKVFDRVAGVVKSGGRTRRAAKMQMLDVTHPDIVKFIRAKTVEEEKAAALMAAGYSGGMDGEALDTVHFQNANLSVRVTDDFMAKVRSGGDWSTYGVKDRELKWTAPAREIWTAICESAWKCGDPGIQFIDTVNRWHTCVSAGAINSSNPCGEYLFLDDSACNLASLNLCAFLVGGEFDTAAFSKAVHVSIRAMDWLVDNAGYPTERICLNSHLYRPLGLGYSSLGGLLMRMGLPYDSDEGRGVARAITTIMTREAYRASMEMAAESGPFEAFAANEEHVRRVYGMHAARVGDNVVPRGRRSGLHRLVEEASAPWPEMPATGVRNAQLTLLAPCGTIAFVMDCDTTGVEPEIALASCKTLTGGGAVVNSASAGVPAALAALGYPSKIADAILAHMRQNGRLDDCPLLDREHLAVFDCALPSPGSTRCVAPSGHMAMMAAVQPMLSGGISKTINMPSTATPADIGEAYFRAHELGLKSVTVYRDGSKSEQPVRVAGKPVETVPACGRSRLPDTRSAITHKFDIAGHEGYCTVGLYDDGAPGELFIMMSKEGSTVRGLTDTIGLLLSLSLQYGVPLEAITGKLKHTRFEPSGITSNKDIRFTTSPMDYISRWLEALFSDKEAGPVGEESSGAPVCPACGTITERSGTCHRCPNCGESLGCS